MSSICDVRSVVGGTDRGTRDVFSTVILSALRSRLRAARSEYNSDAPFIGT